MAYTIELKPGIPTTTIAALLTEHLKKHEFDCWVSTKKSLFELRKVRAVPKAVAPFSRRPSELEWAYFNQLVNDFFDSKNMTADVWATPASSHPNRFWIRRGKERAA